MRTYSTSLSFINFITACPALRKDCESYFIRGMTAPSERGPLHSRGFTITLRHTRVGRTPLDEGSARSREIYLTTHKTHKRQTFKTPAGFEPQSEKAGGRTSTPETGRPLGSIW